MKILYVLPETPATGGGGIATYLANAAQAMRDAGHEVYALTWNFGGKAIGTSRPFDSEKFFNIHIDGSAVWRAFPSGPWKVALS